METQEQQQKIIQNSASEPSADPPTRVCRPTFSREMEHALATKRPDEMTEEELAAKRRFDEWQRQEEEDRERRKRESEEAAREYSRNYRRLIEQSDREASEHSLEWFARQVEQSCKAEPPVKLGLTAEDAERYLQVAYSGEVKKRGGTVKADRYTREVTHSVAKWLVTLPKPGLMLRGYIGVGKTTMMLAVKRMLHLLTDEVMKVADAREIAALAKDAPREFTALKGCKLLGIDDLGTEAVIVKSYGNELSPLAELLASRYSERKFTVITTNLSLKEVSDDVYEDELKAIYGDRILDRLKEMCNTIFYDGEQQSYRV